MRRTLGFALAVVAMSWVLAAGAQAQVAQRFLISKGTRVQLVVVPRRLPVRLWPGQRVVLRVANNVVVYGRLVIPAGTRVYGQVRRSYLRHGYEDTVVLNPLRARGGTVIPLDALPISDVFALGYPLRWQVTEGITGHVAGDVFLNARDVRQPRQRAELRGRAKG